MGTMTELFGTEDDRDKLIARLTHERDVLGKAIAEAGIKAGLLHPSITTSAGPHSIMFVEDLADVILAHEATIKDLEENIIVKADWIEATIADSEREYWLLQEIRTIAETPNPAAFQLETIASIATMMLNKTYKDSNNGNNG